MPFILAELQQFAGAGGMYGKQQNCQLYSPQTLAVK